MEPFYNRLFWNICEITVSFIIAASLVLLVYGEGQLEEFLLEHEPVEKNHAKAKAALASAEDQLHRAGQSRDKVQDLIYEALARLNSFAYVDL